jgi:hypothetical protein
MKRKIDGKKNGEKCQADRFREAARDVEADESDDALENAFKRLDLTRNPGDEKKSKDR